MNKFTNDMEKIMNNVLYDINPGISIAPIQTPQPQPQLQPQPQPVKSSTTLSKGKIIGIVLGVIGFIILVVCAFLIYKYFPNIQAYFSSMQNTSTSTPNTNTSGGISLSSDTQVKQNEFSSITVSNIDVEDELNNQDLVIFRQSPA